MRKRDAVAVSLAILGATFDRKVTAELAEGYLLGLADVTDGQLAAATKRAVSECRFMPTPSELRALAGVVAKRELAIADAWEAVRAAIQRHDYTTSVDFGPLVNAVVRNLGGWLRLCDLDSEALDVWARKEFERVYGLFADKDAAMLNGEPHRGAFGGVPVRIAIAGKLPAPQLEAVSDSAVPLRTAIRALAEEKSR